MKTIFATICSTDFQNRYSNSHNIDFIGFKNSFNKFHSDCQLIIFDEKDLHKHGLNFLNPKATFGRLLKEQNPDANICIIDSDTYIFARMEEILSADYDIAAPRNFNTTGNVVGIKALSGLRGEGHPFTKPGIPIEETAPWIVSDKDFLQGGLVASPSLAFWKHYEWLVKRDYQKYLCYENDILNMVAYHYPYKIKILDGLDPIFPDAYYGCSILGAEKYCLSDTGILKCGAIQIKAYHFAHGSAKRKYTEIFPPETHSFIESIIN